jgi:hypothetical protein
MPPILRAQVFISHASEDKDAVARPLANALKRRGFRVWFDEYVLNIGDSLKRKIDEGLAVCDYGVVILSPHFFGKSWTREELDGLAAREMSSKRKLILPVWHKIDHATIASFSPTLAGKFGISAAVGISRVAGKIARSIKEEDIQHSVQEIFLRSPQGGEIYFRGRANRSSRSNGKITLKLLEKLMRDATVTFTDALDGDKKKPKTDA